MNGSEIAKGGFDNEQDVADRFNNWKSDPYTQAWLQTMMYNLDEIADIKAERIGEKGFKSDVNVLIKIKAKKSGEYKDCIENLQIKLVSTKIIRQRIHRKRAKNACRLASEKHAHDCGRCHSRTRAFRG